LTRRTPTTLRERRPRCANAAITRCSWYSSGAAFDGGSCWRCSSDGFSSARNTWVMTGIQHAGTVQSAEAPVRGSLRLAVSTSSPPISAGSDFSIFVVIQNPFDVPITSYQVQTHIPVELVDVNALRLELAKRENESRSPNLIDAVRQAIKRGLAPPKRSPRSLRSPRFHPYVIRTPGSSRSHR
jgi:hypothetical protein